MVMTKDQKIYIKNVTDIVDPNIKLGIFNEWISPFNLYTIFCFTGSGKRFSKYHTNPRNIFKDNGCKSAETDALMRSILQGIIVGFSNISNLLYSDTSYKEGVRKLIIWKSSVDDLLNMYPYLLSTYSQLAALYYNAYGCYLAEIEKDIDKAKENLLFGALYQLIELSSLIYLKNASLVSPWINNGLGTIYNYNLICSKHKRINAFSSKVKLSLILAYISKYFLAFYDNSKFYKRVYIGWLQYIYDFSSYIIYEGKEHDIISFLISWRNRFEACFCDEMLQWEKPEEFKLLLEELIIMIGDFKSIDDLAKTIYADL